MIKPIDCHCKDCGKVMELWVQVLPKFGDKVDGELCLKCDSENVVRTPNKSALNFKGSGYYVNDYKGKQQ